MSYVDDFIKAQNAADAETWQYEKQRMEQVKILNQRAGDFIKADNELRARQEAAVQAQRKRDREASMHMTGRMLLRFFGGVLLGALFVAAMLAWFWSGR